MYHDKDKLKQTIFILSLFVIGGILYWYLKSFLSSFLGAVVIYILSRRPLFYLTAKEKFKNKWAKQGLILSLMLLSFFVIVLPILLLTLMLTDKVSYLVLHYEDMLHMARQWSDQAKEYLSIDILSGETVNKLTGIAATVIPQFISATANAVISILVMYLILYFLMANARELEGWVTEHLPFKNENNQLLLRELKIQTISNALGIPLIAVVQAVAAFLGYWLFGVRDALFWAVITGLLSFVPVFGAGVAWVSVSIMVYAAGRHWGGLGLFAYCVVVVSSIDNVFRFYMQKRWGDVHPLITFFGVIIGLDIFGFIGIIFGPLLISYFILLLRIYSNEYLEEK